jgi:hypothetical protein
MALLLKDYKDTKPLIKNRKNSIFPASAKCSLISSNFLREPCYCPGLA